MEPPASAQPSPPAPKGNREGGGSGQNRSARGHGHGGWVGAWGLHLLFALLLCISESFCNVSFNRSKYNSVVQDMLPDGRGRQSGASASSFQPAAHLADFSLMNRRTELLNACVHTCFSYVHPQTSLTQVSRRTERLGWQSQSSRLTQEVCTHTVSRTRPVQRRFWSSVAHAQVT